ncbi:hypothetical protein SAMN05443244_1993 [Terriglobus roseus]|uniref:Uncharacterized protein n=1 Tax=Terriglobus roseus TaxID=392734 RepID=A0A1H4MP20_9BACT|nr:hypothetical protein SAMN05443244_1993 [Terriglobus roseus]
MLPVLLCHFKIRPKNFPKTSDSRVGNRKFNLPKFRSLLSCRQLTGAADYVMLP